MASKVLTRFDDVNVELILRHADYKMKNGSMSKSFSIKFGDRKYDAGLIGFGFNEDPSEGEALMYMLAAEPLIGEQSIYLTVTGSQVPSYACVNCPNRWHCRENAWITAHNIERNDGTHFVDIKRCSNNYVRKEVKSILKIAEKSVKQDKEFMDYIDTHKDITLSVVEKDNRMNKFTECVREDYPDTDKSILDYYARHLEELYELLDTQDTIRECFKMYFIDRISVATIARVKKMDAAKVKKSLTRSITAAVQVMSTMNSDLTRKLYRETIITDLPLSKRFIKSLEDNNIVCLGELVDMNKIEFLSMKGVGHGYYNELRRFLEEKNIQHNLDFVPEVVKKEVEKTQDVVTETEEPKEEEIDYKALYEAALLDNEILSDEVSKLKNRVSILQNRIDYKSNSTSIDGLDNLFDGEVLFNVVEMISYYRDMVVDTKVHNRRIDIADKIISQLNVEDIRMQLKSQLEVILKDCEWNDSVISDLRALGFSVEHQGNGHKYVYVTGHHEYGWTFAATTKNGYSMQNGVANLLQIIF